MLFQGNLPQNLWVEAIYTANFLINLLPTSVHDKLLSPFEKLSGQSPVYTALRVFGCACYPYLRPYAKNKFDPKSLVCVFLGYSEHHKGYRCLHPPTCKVYINRHVLFDESRFPYKDCYKSLLKPANTPLLSAWYSQQQVSESDQQQPKQSAPVEPEVISPPIQTTTVTPTQAETPPESPVSNQNNNNSPSSSSTSESSNSKDEAVLEPMNDHSMVTRAKSGIHKPNPRYVLVAVKGIPEEPTTVAAALAHPGGTAAMGDEIETCHETKTWSLVPPPADINLLGCRWVFKTKLNADGTLDKLRARLVAKGYEQEEGVDFLETYSPVVRTATVRAVLHLAVVERWDIKQLDVKNAFLHGDLLETVYMRQPPGFEDKEHPEYVCKLHKAIYGLKQAPRAWFDKFSSFLIEFGFICCTGDPSLFYYQQGRSILLLLLYVDDMVLT